MTLLWVVKNRTFYTNISAKLKHGTHILYHQLNQLGEKISDWGGKNLVTQSLKVLKQGFTKHQFLIAYFDEIEAQILLMKLHFTTNVKCFPKLSLILQLVDYFYLLFLFLYSKTAHNCISVSVSQRIFMDIEFTAEPFVFY